MRVLMGLGGFKATTRREQGGRANGRAHAHGLGDAGSGNIVRRAVIDGCANEWQAKVDADATVKIVHLDGDVALIMVEGDDGVVVACRAAQEYGVGWQRALRQQCPLRRLAQQPGRFPQSPHVRAVRHHRRGG